MQVVKPGNLNPVSLPDYYKVAEREIWGPRTGCSKVAVVYNIAEPDGRSPLDVHPESDHVFYVVRGELKIFDGETEHLVPAGSAMIVPAGEKHQVRGNGREEAEYLVVTCPPPTPAS